MGRRSREQIYQDQLTDEITANLETMDSDEFESKYQELDVDHQIVVDEAIRRFANAAVGVDYWDSDEW